MNKLCIASVAALALMARTLPAVAYTGEELANQSKISIGEARAAALKAFPGTITDQTLQKENGGDGLKYTFDIKGGTDSRVIGVDAQTGQVLGVAPDGPSAK